MSCFRALLNFCTPKSSKHSESTDSTRNGSFELQPLAPSTMTTLEDGSFNFRFREMIPTAPVPALRPQIVTPPLHEQHISATLDPRALAALLRDVDFAHGGDERLPLHTFSANWADDEDSNDGDTEYEFIYEGEYGITWPLRKIRVKDLPAEYDYGNDDIVDPKEEAGEDNELYAIVEVLAVPSRHDSKVDAVPEEFQPDVSATQRVPRRFRVRIRAVDEDTPRFRVRVRTPEEFGNESMRRLPRRRGVLLLERLAATINDGASYPENSR